MAATAGIAVWHTDNEPRLEKTLIVREQMVKGTIKMMESASSLLNSVFKIYFRNICIQKRIVNAMRSDENHMGSPITLRCGVRKPNRDVLIIKRMVRDRSAHPVMQKRTGSFFIKTKNSDKKAIDMVTCLTTSQLILNKPPEDADMDKATSRLARRL